MSVTTLPTGAEGPEGPAGADAATGIAGGGLTSSKDQQGPQGDPGATGPAGADGADGSVIGQCRLRVDSTSQISLQRYQGASLPVKVGGTWGASTIPTAGVALSNSGLVAATLYYVYAYDSAGTLTLEASATGHSTDTDSGVEIKTGDATRTLVGMVYMGAGSPGTFVDSLTQRFCLNWFNRAVRSLNNTFSANRTTASTSLVEVNTEIRVEFLSWSDEATQIGIAGTHMQSNSGQATTTAIGIDSTSVSSQSVSYTASGVNSRGMLSNWLATMLAEGYHFATLLGAVSAGTGTWETPDNVSTGTSKARLWAAIRG